MFMFLGDTACFLMYDALIMLKLFLVNIVSSRVSPENPTSEAAPLASSWAEASFQLSLGCDLTCCLSWRS